MKEIRLCDGAQPKKVIELCIENKLGIEVQGFYNPNMIYTEESENLILDYKQILDGFNNGKSLHAPFWDLNLGTKNPMVREATLKSFNYAYSIAKELGCTEIVVHNGFIPNTSFYQGWVKSSVQFWNDFFKDKDHSITMMIENQCEEDSEVIKMEIDAVNDLRLKVCLDIGHANANSDMSVEKWIKSLGNRIGYLHMHNNHGRLKNRPSFMNDEHLGIDDGTIDIKNVCSLLEEYCPNAIWNLECKLDYIDYSVNVLKGMGYIKECL